MRIKGEAFTKGFGTYACNRLFVFLNGTASRFTAAVGVDANDKQGSVAFKVIGDGSIPWQP